MRQVSEWLILCDRAEAIVTEQALSDRGLESSGYVEEKARLLAMRAGRLTHHTPSQQPMMALCNTLRWACNAWWVMDPMDRAVFAPVLAGAASALRSAITGQEQQAA
ncbi:MAG: hypothetical protein ACK4E3_03525 [Brevundimonas sp.]|uniref:hypothetical protein n=1 Tax=Brevundimonas sp. TaxID=1871086 RepID=UPI00391ACACB